ncbi:substrate-binding domain-containing protein [Microbacterium suwonense]|uniref:substrate-binding domain-containing protein n=1 Tax=Microbacterium suwonense TaxID=683047 RepID=UPI00257391A6|nr:substrate-binding domain-containing protein [Microbacterium suwonense]
MSLVLNDRPSRLSEEAAGRIRTAADQLGYRPDPAAQSLRFGKTRSIGFISDQVTITRFASAMVRGTLRAAKELDHTVLIAETGDDLMQLTESFREMVDRRVDGIVVGLMAARMVDVPTAPHGVPVVIVNGRTPDDLPSVLPDEYEAGHAMASVLLDAGHRRIGLIGDLPAAANPRRSVTITRRFEGLDETLSSAGVTPVRVDVDDWNPEVGYREAMRMLPAHPELTAVIAATDGMAFGIMQALAELGLRVPDDISIVSFDDEDLAAMVRPGLTTARLPYEEMAHQGVLMLLGERELSHELLPMPVVTRGSVRTISERVTRP